MADVNAKDPAPASEAGNTSPAEVLVVEDQFLIAQLVAGCVRQAGAVALGPVGSLGEAERLVATHRPRMAVLNFRLNGDTTAELARRLLAAGRTVVFVTGQAERGTIPADLRGCLCIEKPEIGDRLTEEIRRLLERPPPSSSDCSMPSGLPRGCQVMGTSAQDT